MNVKLRLWIEKDNKPVFGDGRYELLRLIGKNGSINKAAKERPGENQEVERNLLPRRMNFLKNMMSSEEMLMG